MTIDPSLSSSFIILNQSGSFVDAGEGSWARRRNATVEQIFSNPPPQSLIFYEQKSRLYIKGKEKKELTLLKKAFEQMTALELVRMRSRQPLSEKVLDKIRKMEILATEEGRRNLFIPIPPDAKIKQATRAQFLSIPNSVYLAPLSL